MEVKIYRIINQESGVLNITVDDIEEIGSLNSLPPTHTGDVTGDTELTIANNAVDADKIAALSINNAHIQENAVRTDHIASSQVTNPKLGQMASNTIKGNNDISTGTPKDLTISEVKAMLDIGNGSESGNTTNIVTLTDRTNLAELNALTGMSEGDLAIVTNYLNDKVTFIYDGSNWVRAKAQEFQCGVTYDTVGKAFVFVDDTDTTPLGVLNINTRPTIDHQFSITYPAATTIGAVSATLNDEFATDGFFIGVKPGKNESSFKIVRQGFSIKAEHTGSGITFINESAQILQSIDFEPITHDDATGITTIPHSAIQCKTDSRALAHPINNTLRPFVESFTSTSVDVSWWNYSDNSQELVLSPSMGLTYQQLGTFQILGHHLKDAGIIWIKGTMYTA